MEHLLNFNNVSVSEDGDKIVVNNKSMRVVEDYEFTYKLQKTQIRAIGGAKRLVEQVQRGIAECNDIAVIRIGSFALVPHEASWANKVISHVLQNGK